MSRQFRIIISAVLDGPRGLDDATVIVSDDYKVDPAKPDKYDPPPEFLQEAIKDALAAVYRHDMDARLAEHPWPWRWKYISPMDGCEYGPTEIIDAAGEQVGEYSGELAARRAIEEMELHIQEGKPC